jgi:hypothetical protein
LSKIAYCGIIEGMKDELLTSPRSLSKPFLTLLALAYPASVFANILPVVFFAGIMIRTYFLTAVIGIVEGLIVVTVFKAWGESKIRGELRGIGIMVLANYFSFILGEWYLLQGLRIFSGAVLGSEPLYNAHRFIWLSVLVAFVLTILLEWPFCFWILRKKSKSFRKSIAATVLVQTLSYAVLLVFYVSLGAVELYRHMDIDRNLVRSQDENVWVYFVSNDDGDIHRIRLDGTDRQKAFDTDLSSAQRGIKTCNILLWPNDEPNAWDFWLCRDEDCRILQKGIFRGFATLSSGSDMRLEDANTPGDLRERGLWTIVTDLRGPTEHSIEVKIDYFGWQGVTVADPCANQEYKLMIQTPLLTWGIEHVTVLPNDQLVCEMAGQIVIMNLRERKMALLALGLSPVVTLGPAGPGAANETEGASF